MRFKVQAWIETFGSRASKEAGSLFNMLLDPLQSIFGVKWLHWFSTACALVRGGALCRTKFPQCH